MPVEPADSTPVDESFSDEPPFDYAEEFNRASVDEVAPKVISKFAPPPPEPKPATVAPTKKPVAAVEPVQIERSANLPDWASIVEQLKPKGLSKQLAQQSELLVFDDARIELCCENRSLASSVPALRGLEKSVDALYGKGTKKLMVHIGTATTTPAKVQATVRAEQLSAAEDLIANDATIQALVREFDGMILPSSIKAL